MRITRLKLVNFIGIKHGLNRNVIEIDFGKTSKRKIVMLNGGNGSGKSTILSQLHPFKDSFDDRKTIILDGEEGTKEIDIQDGDNFYEIVHYYKKLAQSFIKKNGVEMNENGGVKTFNAYIESEFGLTNDYFKIGKIGSNTENFIEFTATERKFYISKFLPDIEDYLVKFEIVKEKFRVATNDIKVLSNDLSKLEEEESVKTKISSYGTLITNLDKEIEKTSGDVAVYQANIDDFTKETANVDIVSIILDKNAKEKRKKEVLDRGVEFVNKYNGKKDTSVCEMIIEDKTKITTALNNEITTLNANKQNTNSLIISCDNDIKTANFNLNELKTTDDIGTINNKIDITDAEIKDIQEDMNKKDIYKVVQSNLATIPTQLSKFESFKNFIIKYYTNLRQSTLIPAKSNIDLFLTENFSDDLDRQVISIRNFIIQKKAFLEIHKNELSKKEINLGKVDILGQRPVDCKINTCPFIKDALQYQNLPEEIEAIKTEIDQIKKDIETYELKADNITELKTLFQSFTYNFDQMNPRTNKVYEYFINNSGTLVENIMGPINEFTIASEQLVSDINDALTKIQKLSVANTNLENLKYKKNFVENNATIRKQITDTIDSKKKEKDDLVVKLLDITKQISDKMAVLKSETVILNDYKEFLSGKKEIASLRTMLSTIKTTEDNFNSKTALIKVRKVDLEASTKTLNELKQRKLDSHAELSKAKTMLANIELLKTKKTSIEKDYNNLRVLKDSLDPNRGIPLYFIKSYLEKTKDIANELLNIAFDDNFEINFVTNEKEFFIQVRAGENIKNDIKEASQGEMALTTISISLALIEQAIGKFNILALDEIDGPLDSTNRMNFISIMNKQIDKMGIEQIFVISHNDAFDTEAMDLILLNGSNVAIKGDEFMKNKSIIFEV